MEVDDFRWGFQDVFLPALETALDSPADFAEIRDAICAHARALIERHRHGWPPNRHPYNLEFAAFMIGARHVLCTSRPDTEIRQLLEAALERGFASMTERISRGLDECPDAFDALVSISKERETSFFGDGFTFDRAAESDTTYHLEITHCWFVSICRVEGAMGIARAFCAFDAIWFNAIDSVRHGARFERPTVIAAGSDRCRFYFDRA